MNASCMGDRKSIGKKCVSGKYDFSNETWIQNAEAYNGDVYTADFIVKYPDNIQLTKNGIEFKLTPPNPLTRDNPGIGARISSTSYLMYGRFSAKFTASRIKGVVVAFISMSDEQDELDWEITGKSPDAQTNIFIKGVHDYTPEKSTSHDLEDATMVHEYTVDWDENRILWELDGKVVRELRKENSEWGYPDTPSRIQFAIWDGGAGSEGTRNWAGGYINWKKYLDIKVRVEEMTIQCAGDEAPTGHPQRLTGYKAPTLQDPELKAVVPGLAGYYQNKYGYPANAPYSPRINIGIVTNPVKANMTTKDSASPKTKANTAWMLIIGIFGLFLL